jgi:hypothetical protein
VRSKGPTGKSVRRSTEKGRSLRTKRREARALDARASRTSTRKRSTASESPATRAPGRSCLRCRWRQGFRRHQARRRPFHPRLRPPPSRMASRSTRCQPSARFRHTPERPRGRPYHLHRRRHRLLAPHFHRSRRPPFHFRERLHLGLEQPVRPARLRRPQRHSLSRDRGVPGSSLREPRSSRRQRYRRRRRCHRSPLRRHLRLRSLPSPLLRHHPDQVRRSHRPRQAQGTKCSWRG